MRALPLVMLLLTACPSVPVPAGGKCSATTCGGCCDANEVCQTGLSPQACGLNGFQCTQCSAASTCSLGACVASSTGGGAAGGGVATGGGEATGGGTTGGGSATGGGGGGGGGSAACTPSNCASGCCVGPLCLTSAQNDSACGSGGVSCQPCSASSHCASGQCVQTNTCTPASCPTGCCAGNLCVPYGSQSEGICGTAGAACKACDVGLSCSSGVCGAASSCDFFSCAGCCVGTSCIGTSAQSSVSCGVNGSACKACQNGSTCVAGVCSGGSTCNATTCSGCCNGNSCVTSTTDVACGQQGSACVSCGPGHVCSGGTCITQALPACIVISPNDYDFGSVKLTCRSPVRMFTLRNVCGSAITVNALGLSGSPAFTLSSAPALPAALTTTLEFQVTFTPSAVSNVSTTLVVGASQNSASTVYQTVLTGAGSSSNVNTDVFTIPLKTDVVLIVDNSGSMADKQNGLGANGNALFAYPVSAGVDFNLGVTSTDFSDPDAGVCLPVFGCQATSGERGAFVPDGGSNKVLKSSTPNLLAEFNTRVRLGTEGSGSEMMFAPAVAATTPPLIIGNNAGFLRTDSNLSYLVVTDAADQSPDVVAAYYESILSLKGWRQRNRISYSAIVPTLASAPAPCTYDGDFDSARNLAMVSLTGGVSAEICDLLDAGVWRPEARVVSEAVFGARATWFLTAMPWPATAASITVKVAGNQIPEVGTARNWTYDLPRNAIVFERVALPAPGLSVSISYPTACEP